MIEFEKAPNLTSDNDLLYTHRKILSLLYFYDELQLVSFQKTKVSFHKTTSRMCKPSENREEGFWITLFKGQNEDRIKKKVNYDLPAILCNLYKILVSFYMLLLYTYLFYKGRN